MLMTTVKGPRTSGKRSLDKKLTISIPITTIQVSLKLCDESVERVKIVIKNHRTPTDRNVPNAFIFLANVEVWHRLPGAPLRNRVNGCANIHRC